MSKGRVTIPTDKNFIEGTKKIIELWGADAVRDCDGTELPENALELADKVYKTYFLARGDNPWAKAHPEYLQNIALMTEVLLATEDTLKFNLMADYYDQQVCVNEEDDSIARWQVFDRTTGKEHKDWSYEKGTNVVTVNNVIPMHEYTVNFFVKDLWDFVQIYNYTTNGWTCEKDIDVDPIFPEVQDMMERNLRKWLSENKNVNTVRFTTLFYNFMAVHKKDEKHTKYFDWYSYAFTASPKMFQMFEEETGKRITLEDIVDCGYYANNFRVPSRIYLDYCDFVERFVTKTAKKFVDIVHEYGKEALMFWGDNWMGAEPYGKYFKEIGMDGIVGSVNSAWTMRLLADAPSVTYREARMLPYFFPDTLYNDEEGTKFLLENWVTGRRAIMRSPVDRIGFGGYLSLAAKFPNFVKTAGDICEEFRQIYDIVDNKKPYCFARIAVLTAWGKKRSWMMDSICLDGSHQRVETFQGIHEMLSGMPFDVAFIDFNDVKNGVLDDYDILMNLGVAGNAFSGGELWDDGEVIEKINAFVYNGGGLIGFGEPSAYKKNGRYFQLARVLGVDREMSDSMFQNKFNYKKVEKHFITEEVTSEVDYGTPVSNIYALEGAEILDVIPNARWGIDMNKGHVMLCANKFGKGRSCYMSGLKYNLQNMRMLYRALLYCADREDGVKRAFSDNLNTECHYYPESGKYIVVNNSEQNQVTNFYDINGAQKTLKLSPYGIVVVNEK